MRQILCELKRGRISPRECLFHHVRVEIQKETGSPGYWAACLDCEKWKKVRVVMPEEGRTTIQVDCERLGKQLSPRQCFINSVRAETLQQTVGNAGTLAPCLSCERWKELKVTLTTKTI